MGEKIPNDCRPPRLPRRIASRNGELIENPDSWRKIRETAAILYREDVRAAFVADWEHGGGTLLPGFSAARPG
jgi:hypothetical protein